MSFKNDQDRLNFGKGSDFARDPIFIKAGYYFWDETWSRSHGPYDSEELAREALYKYCEELNSDNLMESNDE